MNLAGCAFRGSGGSCGGDGLNPVGALSRGIPQAVRLCAHAGCDFANATQSFFLLRRSSRLVMSRFGTRDSTEELKSRSQLYGQHAWEIRLLAVG